MARPPIVKSQCTALWDKSTDSLHPVISPQNFSWLTSFSLHMFHGKIHAIHCPEKQKGLILSTFCVPSESLVSTADERDGDAHVTHEKIEVIGPNTKASVFSKTRYKLTPKPTLHDVTFEWHDTQELLPSRRSQFPCQEEHPAQLAPLSSTPTAPTICRAPAVTSANRAQSKAVTVKPVHLLMRINTKRQAR